MALLKELSIKWKLSLALLLTGLCLLSAYVFMAKRTFESDKISYVYDAQSGHLDSLRSELQSKLDHILMTARTVVGNFDFVTGKPTTLGQQFFDQEASLLAIELWNEKNSRILLHIEKKGSSLSPIDPQKFKSTPLGQVDLEPSDSGRAILTIRYSQDKQGIFILRALIDLKHILPKPTPSQSIALGKDKQILIVSDLRGIEEGVFKQIANQFKGQERTQMFTFGDNRYLVGQTKVGIADLRLFAVTPEADALGALKTLFDRSIVFLILSFFGLVAVSLTLARSLTLNLLVLTKSAEEIGAGNFNAAPAIQSKDEMGVLANAFAKMSREIKRLLIETEEKTRMEEELKTASLIQERLMPKESTTDIGEIEISGMVITSSECGGDWWYYFKRGDDLFVAIADATGHGTPAALITAAARSIFARLEKEDLSLIDMMRAWDFSVSSCSQKQVFMTGVLFRINSVTGQGAFVNAAHEAPFILRAQENGSFELDHQSTEPSPRIGDNIGPDVTEQPFALAPNDSVVLFTDGLFSVVREGKSLSERRFGKNLVNRAPKLRTAKDLLLETLSAFNEHRQGLPLPDDVSIVVIRRKGPDQIHSS